jgi:hypothetical protein
VQTFELTQLKPQKTPPPELSEATMLDVDHVHADPE